MRLVILLVLGLMVGACSMLPPPGDTRVCSNAVTVREGLYQGIDLAYKIEDVQKRNLRLAALYASLSALDNRCPPPS